MASSDNLAAHLVPPTSSVDSIAPKRPNRGAQQADELFGSCSDTSNMPGETVSAMLSHISAEIRKVFAEQCCTLCADIVSSIRAELSIQRLRIEEPKQASGWKETPQQCRPDRPSSTMCFSDDNSLECLSNYSPTASASKKLKGRQKVKGPEPHESRAIDVVMLKSQLDELTLKGLTPSKTDLTPSKTDPMCTRPDTSQVRSKSQGNAEALDEHNLGGRTKSSRYSSEDNAPELTGIGHSSIIPTPPTGALPGTMASCSEHNAKIGTASSFPEREPKLGTMSSFPEWNANGISEEDPDDMSEPEPAAQSFGTTMMATLQRVAPIDLSSLGTIRRSSVEEVRRRRNSELLATLSQTDSNELVHMAALPLPLIIPRLLGVVPFASKRQCTTLWYQRSAFIFMMLACFVCVLRISSLDDFAFHAHGFCTGDHCVHLGILSDLPLAFGSIVGLLALKVPMGSSALCHAYRLLATHAKKEGFSNQWARRSRQDLVIVAVVWLSAVFERVRGSGALTAAASSQLKALDVLHILAFMAISAVVMTCVLCVLWMSAGLVIGVDMYCMKVWECSDLTTAVREWDLLQALIRKTCKSIEHCFFALQTMAFAMIITAVADSNRDSPVLLLPGAFLTLGIGQILWRAAKVTSSCAHVPSLINSLWFGKFWDELRLYAVQYITYTAAAYYVYGVTINFALAIKLVYVVGVVAFQLVTRFFAV